MWKSEWEFLPGRFYVKLILVYFVASKTTFPKPLAFRNCKGLPKLKCAISELFKMTIFVIIDFTWNWIGRKFLFHTVICFQYVRTISHQYENVYSVKSMSIEYVSKRLLENCLHPDPLSISGVRLQIAFCQNFPPPAWLFAFIMRLGQPYYEPFIQSWIDLLPI